MLFIALLPAAQAVEVAVANKTFEGVDNTVNAEETEEETQELAPIAVVESAVVESDVTAQNDYCSSANKRDLNARISGHINPSGDVDWFKFSLPSYGKVKVDLEVPSSKDYDLEVYSSCSKSECDSTRGKSRDETCTTPPVSGKVYAKVYGHKGSFSATKKYYIKGSFQAVHRYDLVPEYFSITPSSPYENDAISIRYRVKNQGSDTINSHYKFKLYIDDDIYQTCKSDDDTEPGKIYYCDLDNVRLAAGEHTLKNVVDADNEIEETKEKNNVKTYNLRVNRKILQHDLSAGNIVVTPSNPYDTTEITIEGSVKNLGPDGISKAFTSTIEIDGGLYKTCYYASLAYNGNAYCSYTGRLSSGNHRILFKSDIDNVIAETNEGNNYKESNVYVQHDASQDYDLKVINIGVEPALPKQGENFRILVDIDNLQPTSINKGFNNKVKLNGNFVGECYAYGLADGKTFSCAVPGILLNSGSWPVEVIADYGNAVAEVDENNNIGHKQITIAPPPRYDIYISSLWVEPNKVIDGQQFNAKFVVTNLEEDAIPNSFIAKLYNGGDYLGYCTIPSGLTKGNGHTCNVAVPGLLAGSYSLKAVGDVNKDVSEVNEENNQRIISLNVAAKPCAVPDGSSASCDCNYHSDCPAGYPYCQDEYPAPISDYYDACLASKPLYCGDGSCNNGESWQSCGKDCSPPLGRIFVDVKNNQRYPVTGAFVYLDDVFKGSTSSLGKVDFSAGYGGKNVKIHCPDNKYCDTKSVSVDGNEYASFQCGCEVLQKGALRVITQDKENLPIANVKVYVDGNYKDLTNFLGVIDTSELSYGVHTLIIETYVADASLQEASPKYIIRNVNLNKEFQEEVFTLSSLDSFNGQVVASTENGAVLQSDDGQKVTVQLVPLIIIAVVVVGGALWDLGDFSQCATRGESWWGSTWDYTSTLVKCNDVVNYFTNNRACLNKLRQYNQYAVENCKLEGAFLASNFLLVGAVSKVGVKIGKAGIKLIPHIDDAFRVVKESESVIKAIKGYTAVTYRIEKGIIKLDKNVVGLLVEASLKAGASEELAERIGKRLSATTFRDLVNPHNVGNIKGELGEIIGNEQMDFGLGKLAKDGAKVQKLTGTGIKNTVLNVNGKSFIDDTLKVEFDSQGKLIANGKTLNSAGKWVWKPLTEYDGLYVVDDILVIGEFKASNSWHILESLDKSAVDPKIPFDRVKSAQKVIDNRLTPLEHFYGKKPEIILLTPKDVNLIHLSDTESGMVVQILAELRKKGYVVTTDVLPIGLSGKEGFDALSDTINKAYREANPGGGS